MTKNQSDARTLRDDLQATWAHFQELAARAERETKQYGQPDGMTTLALDRLNDRLDRLQATLDNPTPAGGLFTPTSVKTFTLNGEPVAYETGTGANVRFARLLRYGTRGADADQASLTDLSELTRDSIKAMRLGDDTTGGYLCSPEWASDVLRRSVAYSPIRQVARVVPIGSGQDLFQPVRNAPVAAVRVSETGSRAPLSDYDLSLAAASVPTYEMMAPVKVSRQLALDSKYDITAEVANASAASFSLLEGKEAVKGSGVGEMRGLDNTSLAAGNIATCADSTNHTVAGEDLAKLIYETLPSQYLATARLFLHPKTLGKLRQLRGTATSGAFLLDAGPGYVPQIMGLPYTLMPDMDEQGAAGKNAVYCADMRQAFTLVQRQDLTVIRAVEKYAETGQLLLLVVSRSGGQVVDTTALARLVTA